MHIDDKTAKAICFKHPLQTYFTGKLNPTMRGYNNLNAVEMVYILQTTQKEENGHVVMYTSTIVSESENLLTFYKIFLLFARPLTSIPDIYLVQVI